MELSKQFKNIIHRTNQFSVSKDLDIEYLESFSIKKKKILTIKGQTVTSYTVDIIRKLAFMNLYGDDVQVSFNNDYPFSECFVIPAFADGFTVCKDKINHFTIYATAPITGCSFYCFVNKKNNRAIFSHMNWLNSKDVHESSDLNDGVAINDIILNNSDYLNNDFEVFGFSDTGYTQLSYMSLKHLNESQSFFNSSFVQDGIFPTTQDPIKVFYLYDKLYIFFIFRVSKSSNRKFKYSFLFESTGINRFKIIEYIQVE